MFGENDHLFKEKHIDKHLQYTQMLPDDRISGLIQYEEDEEENEYPIEIEDKENFLQKLHVQKKMVIFYVKY